MIFLQHKPKSYPKRRSNESPLILRSDMASKGITVIGGVIDPDYTGAIEIIIHNSTNTNYRVRIGEKIAQFILLKICIPEPTVVTELKDTERGEQGFGHTDNVQTLSRLDEKLILKGIVQQTEVKILIDSGAGIDYISDKLVKEIGLLPSTMRNPLCTKVADGHVYEINQYLPTLPVDITDFKETISPKVLLLQEKEIILGYCWLKKRNPIINWKNKTLQITVDNKTFTLQGESPNE